MTFTDYVQGGLEAAGLTRYALAKRLGRSVTATSRVLHAESACGASEEFLREIATALNLDGDRLVALSAELYPEGSPRRVSATRLAKIRQLEEDNRRLQDELMRFSSGPSGLEGENRRLKKENEYLRNKNEDLAKVPKGQERKILREEIDWLRKENEKLLSGPHGGGDGSSRGMEVAWLRGENQKLIDGPDGGEAA